MSTLWIYLLGHLVEPVELVGPKGFDYAMHPFSEVTHLGPSINKGLFQLTRCHTMDFDSWCWISNS